MNSFCFWTDLSSKTTSLFFIICVASTLFNIKTAVLNDFHPNIERTHPLINRWSCSTILLRYLTCLSCIPLGICFSLFLYLPRILLLRILIELRILFLSSFVDLIDIFPLLHKLKGLIFD